MEPFNRPYVDPDTKPGDEGTEAWADETPDEAAKHAADRGPLAQGGAKTDDEGVIVGSPADEFDDGDAIDARNDDAG